MNNFQFACKINHFLIEKGKKKGYFQHFNIFCGCFSLRIEEFFLSLLSEYIKINQKGGFYMASKKTLKHVIHSICENLFAEAVAVSLYGAKGQQGKAEALLFSIVKVEDDYIRRASHPEPGLPAKKYIKNLREQFAAQVSDIIDQMNS